MMRFGSSSLIFLIGSLFCLVKYGVCGSIDRYDLENVLADGRKPSATDWESAPLTQLYFKWLAENLQNQNDLNASEIELYHVLMEKRDKNIRIPAIEAYFIYKINRKKCINLGDEGCVNGSILGSGSDSGYLNSGNNPGK